MRVCLYCGDEEKFKAVIFPMVLTKQLCSLALLTALIACFIFYIRNSIQLSSRTTQNYLCWSDLENENEICRPSCQKYHFSLPNFSECVPWLQCDVINQLPLLEVIGQGAVKMVYKSKVAGQDVAVNVRITDEYLSDFNHGLRMLDTFQQDDKVVQLLGYCRQSNTFVTEYHRFGSLSNLNDLMQRKVLKKHNTLKQRFQLCINYVELIDFLHYSPAGCRVMCDSNDLNKTLQQYLLRSDLTIILNDLDALPEVGVGNEGKIKCGHKELFGNFVAPEQLWPNDDFDFDDDEMPGYDEKTDIWKIPRVCNWLLGETVGAIKLKFDLYEIHSLCQSDDPHLRPDTSAVLTEYLRIQKNFLEK